MESTFAPSLLQSRSKWINGSARWRGPVWEKLAETIAVTRSLKKKTKADSDMVVFVPGGESDEFWRQVNELYVCLWH